MKIFKQLFKRKDYTDQINSMRQAIESPIIEEDALARINHISQLLIDSVNETKQISNSIITKLSDDLSFTKRQIDIISSNLSDGLITVDADGTILTFNESAEHIFKYPNSFAIGANVNSFLKFDSVVVDDNESYAVIKESFKTINRLTELELPYKDYAVGVCGDASNAILDISVNSITKNNTSTFIIVIRDITEKTNLFGKLNETITFKNDLLYTVPFPIYWKDTDHIIIGCNPAFEQFAKMESDKIIGKKIEDLHIFTSAARIIKLENDMLRDKDDSPKSFNVKLHLVGSSEEKEFLLSKKLSKDQHGEVTGIISVIIDLSNVNRYQRIKSIPLKGASAIYWKDENLKFVGCNKGFEKIFGLKQKDILGKTTIEVHGERSGKSFSEDDYNLIRSNKNCMMSEYIFFNDKTNSEINVRIYKAKLIDPYGNLQGIIGFVI